MRNTHLKYQVAKIVHKTLTIKEKKGNTKYSTDTKNAAHQLTTT
jgi:hypothetical protein